MICLFLHSLESKTELGLPEPLNMKNAVFLLSFPVRNSENCIQCNKCAYVCPHASIRPFVLDEAELAASPYKAGETLEMKVPAAMKGMHFRMQVDVLDCLGCGNCVDVCPGDKNGKALVDVRFGKPVGRGSPLGLLCREMCKSKQHSVRY